jgi:agmatinase
MSRYYHPERFLALPEPQDAAKTGQRAAWILPLPLDMTGPNKGGARLAPSAVLEASAQGDLGDSHDPHTDSRLAYTLRTLESFHPQLASPQAAVESIHEAVQGLALGDAVLVSLGGEHLITAGLVPYFAARWPELIVVQLDARPDLLDAERGSPYTSRTVMRRCAELARIYQFGIRAVASAEADYLQRTERVTVWTASAMQADTGLKYLDDLRALAAGKPIYLTIDMSVFDPAVMPEASSTHPSGLSWASVLALIDALAASGSIVAFDCVELNPRPGSLSGAHAVAALVYFTLNAIFRAPPKPRRPTNRLNAR